MKKIRYIVNLCISFFFLTSVLCYSQVPDFYANYLRALQLYNNGMADSALNLLKPCIENKKELNKIPKETCAGIFRLSALSSIMAGNPADAEEYIKKMLSYQPYYKSITHKDDLMEFRMILERTHAQPSLRISATAGFNIPLIKSRKEYSNYVINEREVEFEDRTGYLAAISGEISFTRRISMEIGAGIDLITFKYNIYGKDNLYENTQFSYDQKMGWIEVPLAAKYYLSTRAFKPYVAGGIFGRFSLYRMEKSDDFGKYWLSKSVNSEMILTSFLTDIGNFGILVGAGALYDFKNLGVKLDFRYFQNLKNSGCISNFKTIEEYDNIPETEKFRFTDDINLLSLKNMQVSVGLIYNLKYKVFK